MSLCVLENLKYCFGKVQFSKFYKEISPILLDQNLYVDYKFLNNKSENIYENAFSVYEELALGYDLFIL